MATYKKPNKMFQGSTMMGVMFSAIDENGKRDGSYAIDAFEGKKIIKAKVQNDDALIPFHAVSMAMYGTMTEDFDKLDPYGCEDNRPETVTITVYQGRADGRRCENPIGTFEAEKGVPTKVPASAMPSDKCCFDDYINQWIVEEGSAEIRNDGVYITAEVDTAAYPYCQQTI